jgi:hypothetical protein
MEALRFTKLMPSPFHSIEFLFQNISTNIYVFSHATFTINGIGFALLNILTTNNNASTWQHKTFHKTFHVELLH